jgi:hypothetical protein
MKTGLGGKIAARRKMLRQGGRMLDQGSRRAAGFLPLPRRALEASTNEQRDRKLVRDHPPPHGAIQGMSFEQDRARHDLQTCRGRREKLASSRGHNQLPKVILGIKFTDGIEVIRSQAQAAA